MTIKGTVFHEIAAAAIPVLLLALTVEHRQVASRPILRGRGRIGFGVSFVLQFLTLGAAEFASLLQLAYQWSRLNVFASVPYVVSAITGALFYLGFVAALDVFDRSKDDKARADVAARWSDQLARSKKIREQVAQLEAQHSGDRDLVTMIELRGLNASLAEMDAEFAKTSFEMLKLFGPQAGSASH